MDHSNLGFLVNDVGRLYRRRFDEATRSFGVTGPQMRAILAIMMNPGINQGALAERLDVEPITTCRMVDRLEQAGLVERRRDPADRRAWQLHLTAASEAMRGKMKPLGEKVIDQSIEGMDAAMVAATMAGLLAIHANLSKESDREAASGDEGIAHHG